MANKRLRGTLKRAGVAYAAGLIVAAMLTVPTTGAADWAGWYAGGSIGWGQMDVGGVFDNKDVHPGQKIDHGRFDL